MALLRKQRQIMRHLVLACHGLQHSSAPPFAVPARFYVSAGLWFGATVEGLRLNPVAGNAVTIRVAHLVSASRAERLSWVFSSRRVLLSAGNVGILRRQSGRILAQGLRVVNPANRSRLRHD